MLWVRSSSVARFEEHVRRILDHLKLGSANASLVDAMQLLQTWLQDSANGKWLLVLDNLDDDDCLHHQLSTSQIESSPSPGKALVDYLPHTGHGKILCTSRSTTATRRIVDDLDIFQVGAMQEADAVNLVKVLLGNAVPSSETAALVNAVDCMPLAIACACEIISRRSSDVEEFLEKLHRSEMSRRILLSRGSGNLNEVRKATYTETLTEVWSSSFRRVEVARPSASDLLGILSFFDPDCIPQQLLSLWHAEFRGKTSREARQERTHSLDHETVDQDLDADIASLLALSLVRISTLR